MENDKVKETDNQITITTETGEKIENTLTPELIKKRDYENDLIKRIKKGDKDASIELINRYTLMVYKIVNKYSSNENYGKDDLAQEGFIAILKCAKKFKPEKNILFSTYVYIGINNNILNYIYKERGCFANNTSLNRYNSFKNSLRKTFEKQGLDMKDFEETCIKNFNYSENATRIINTIDLSNTCKLDEKIVSDKGSMYISEMIPSNVDIEKDFIEEDYRLMKLNWVQDFLKKNYTEDNIKIFNMFFGLNNEEQTTQQVIAKKFNVSQECISTKIKRMVRKLRYVANVQLKK